MGQASVILRKDASGGYVDQHFTITVKNQNQAPNIISSPITGINQGSLYNYTVNATDPDLGDTLIYSEISLPS